MTRQHSPENERKRGFPVSVHTRIAAIRLLLVFLSVSFVTPAFAGLTVNTGFEFFDTGQRPAADVFFKATFPLFSLSRKREKMILFAADKPLRNESYNVTVGIVTILSDCQRR
jgi:hypothetical protein